LRGHSTRNIRGVAHRFEEPRLAQAGVADDFDEPTPT
jgi:hypothetical protein